MFLLFYSLRTAPGTQGILFLVGKNVQSGNRRRARLHFPHGKTCLQGETEFSRVPSGTHVWKTKIRIINRSTCLLFKCSFFTPVIPK